MSGLAPVVGVCYRAGRRCESYVLFCHLNSFCRVFFSSTLATSQRLRVALAKGDYNLSRHTPVYKVPCRTMRKCLGHLITGKCGITVYRRMRSPGATGKVMGHRIMEVIAPKAGLSARTLSRAGGGCVVYVICVTSHCNITVTSVSAKSCFIARLPSDDHLVSRVCGFDPSRVVYGRTFCVDNVSLSTVESGLKVAVCSLSS